MPFSFLQNTVFRSKNLTLLVPDYLVYYLSLHIKFSSRTRECQLLDIFAYENPVTLSSQHSTPNAVGSTLVYHFHNLFSQERLFLFVTSLYNTQFPSPKSVQELYTASWWLEREAGELHGICFENKKDLRNLMLQYGDASAPFKKSYPSIGYKEVIYDSVADTVVQVPVTIQV
jgi:NADH:ubiquinone oxidoreductase subunit C